MLPGITTKKQFNTAEMKTLSTDLTDAVINAVAGTEDKSKCNVFHSRKLTGNTQNCNPIERY